MRETTGVVEGGAIRLPNGVQIAEGTNVRVLWNEDSGEAPYLEREELTEEDVKADLRWSTGKQFRP